MSSKIAKIALYFLAGIFLLAFTIMAVIRSDFFQNWAVKRAASYLQAELNTRVEVGRIELRFPGLILLQDLTLFDQQGDTLIHTSELRAGIKRSYKGKGDLTLSKVELTNPDVYLRRRADGLNLNFLVNYFTPDVPDSTVTPMAITAETVELKNGRFLYLDEAYEAADYGPFKENHILVSGIFAEFDEFYLINDSLHFKIKALKARDHSGLAIRSMNAQTTISRSELSFETLDLKTNSSRLKGDISFYYKGYPMLSDFIDSVEIQSDLNDSRISAKDLAFFSYDLIHSTDVFQLRGQLNGYVRDLYSDQVTLRSEQMGSFQGKFRLSGLPDWKTMHMELHCRDLQLQPFQLKNVLGSENSPEMINRLGELRYRGLFQGYYNDFTALGDLSTALGSLNGDIRMNLKDNALASYSGKLKSEGFNFGKLYEIKDLGESAFNLSLDGKGLELNTFRANVKGQIQSLELMNYRYSGISMNGKLENRLFSGVLESEDSNARFTFGGTIDLSGGQPNYNFLADITNLNTGALGFDSEKSRLSGKLDIRITGSQLDDLFGLARLQHLDVWRNEKHYTFSDIVLLSEIAGYERDIFLNSEMLTAHLHGNFLLTQVDEIWKELRASLLPDYFDAPEALSSDFEMDIESSLFDAGKFIDLFQLPLKLSTGEISGAYNSKRKELSLNIDLATIGYDLFLVNGLNLRVSRESGKMLVFDEYSADIQFGNRIFSQRSAIQGKVGGNQSEFSLSLADSAEQFFIHTQGQTLFADQAVYLKLKQGHIQIDSSKWWLDSSNQFEYRSAGASLRNFKLKRGDQELRVDADLTAEKQESHIYLSRFDLSLINRFMADSASTFGGTASGLLSTERSFKRPLIYSDLIIEDLELSGDTMGDLKLISNSINPDRPLEMSVTASVQDGLLKDLLLNGTVDISVERNYINLELEWNEGDVRPLERFTTGIASGLSGRVNARALVKGNLAAPKIRGTAQFTDTRFTVDYLGTEYRFNHRLTFSEKDLTIQALRVYDKNGNSALINGLIQHNYLADMQYKIDIREIKNLLCLDVSKDENDYFYGKAYADGSCMISGDLYNVDFIIKAKSRKGTHLYLPLDYSEENVTAGFVRFTTFDNQWDLPREKESTRESGYTMDFNLELTKDADVWLIFDEQLGDIIKGNGSGNIKMEMNSEGAFYMYGDYIINNGKYQYTALNFFSKEFNIEQGSKLQWDGDPYQARIDITAIKREMAAPYDLMAAYSNDQAMLEQMRSNVPVDCKLELSGLLLNPEIKFDFEISELGNTANSAMAAQFNTIIQQIKTDPDEVNRQVFSLLVLGTFIPPTFGQGSSGNTALTGVQNTYRNSVSDLISNQLSNWISQIDPKWQVGLNWQAAGEQTARELIVSVKRKFLNERLEFAGSVDAGSSYNYTPYNLNLRYNISSDGRFMVHGFTRQVNDPTLGNITNITTTGVGLYYRKQFDRIFRRKKSKQTEEQ